MQFQPQLADPFLCEAVFRLYKVRFQLLLDKQHPTDIEGTCFLGSFQPNSILIPAKSSGRLPCFHRQADIAPWQLKPRIDHKHKRSVLACKFLICRHTVATTAARYSPITVDSLRIYIFSTFSFPDWACPML